MRRGVPLEPKDGATIDRILQLMDQAEARGIGPSCNATRHRIVEADAQTLLAPIRRSS